MHKAWLFAALMLLAACGGDKVKKLDQKSYADTKKDLAEKEKNSPADFLTIASHEKRSLFGIGGQTITKGQVTNNASVCSYKDVRIKMECFNKSGARIEEHEDLMDDVIGPGESASFRTHYKLPSETDSIALSIMSATPIVPGDKK